MLLFLVISLTLLKLYDYNLNSILHNLYNQQKKITDDVYDNSLSLVNGDKIKKFQIKHYFRNPMEYTLIGLHLLDYTTNFQIKDKKDLFNKKNKLYTSPLEHILYSIEIHPVLVTG